MADIPLAHELSSIYVRNQSPRWSVRSNEIRRTFVSFFLVATSVQTHGEQRVITVPRTITSVHPVCTTINCRGMER